MAFAIRFTTDNRALDYMVKVGPSETCDKYVGHLKIAHSYVGSIAFANR